MHVCKHFPFMRWIFFVCDTAAMHTVLQVKSLEDVKSILTRGFNRRAVGATAMNQQSSRSHCVLQCFVSGENATTRERVRGRLTLVDLAGSERVKRSEATGTRLVEAAAINKSLSSLGNVIQALAAKRSHVPYRDSALTSILASCLGGDSKCLMLVNVSPNLAHASETMSSLRFAQQVNNCELGAAKKNC